MDNKVKGIILIIFSALCFALMAAMVKLSGDIPLFEKVFFRNLISLFIAFWIAKKENVSLFGSKKNQLFLMGRSIFGLLGVVLHFYAINNLLLADASILNKLSPFFVTIFAFVFLKEKLSFVQIPAFVMVIIGAMLIIKPKFELTIIPATAGFLSAIFAAAAYILLRVLRDKEEYSTIVFYFSLVSVLAMLPLTVINYKHPTPMQFVYLMGTGIFAALAQFSITLAYKYAEASEIAIYDYTNIIFASVVGFIIWKEVPDVFSLFGGALIIIAGCMVFIYNKVKKSNNREVPLK
ncbi:DMT family transporter [Alkalithermobacter paradoxus]|uniref:EamA-like transporter family protein n=1 Tax=Alkalithermobacter paradoxus TaxID=29349 RepID=A0A1V4IB24_9FIRM|nr:EamA-like transporter family protein [[Clostridium] thermoalcaliphilum]